jgi:uncharacterized protein YcsI (UPF0317 family)
MPAEIRRTAARVAAALSTLVLLGGCFVHGEVAERRPLTMAELAVRIVPGQMHVSIGLQKQCRPVGTIERINNEYDMRVQAVANGGNVVQLINQMSYTQSDNNSSVTTSATDVRFWACPVAPQAAVPVPDAVPAVPVE